MIKNYVLVHRNQVDDALNWAKAHCPSYISNTGHPDRRGVYSDELYRFYFTGNAQGQKEMTVFTLKWGHNEQV